MILSRIAHKEPKFGTAKLVKILQTARLFQYFFEYFRRGIFQLTLRFSDTYDIPHYFSSNIFDTASPSCSVFLKPLNIKPRRISYAPNGAREIQNALIINRLPKTEDGLLFRQRKRSVATQGVSGGTPPVPWGCRGILG